MCQSNKIRRERERINSTELFLLCNNNFNCIAAFNAQESYGHANPTTGQTVQFNVETLDIGSGYNNRTSVYTAPMAGTYTFTWTIRSLGGATQYYVTGLVVNNDVKNSLMTYSHSHNDVSTATTVVSLEAGDVVFIRVQNRAG